MHTNSQTYIHKETKEEVRAIRFTPVNGGFHGQRVLSDAVMGLRFFYLEGGRRCYEGDYVVQHPDGKMSPVPFLEFQDSYMLTADKELPPGVKPNPPVPTNDLENLFTYHPPKGDQAIRYEHIRVAGREFAKVIERLCPQSADRTVAIRCIREAVMWSNSAIATTE